MSVLLCDLGRTSKLVASSPIHLPIGVSTSASPPWVCHFIILLILYSTQFDAILEPYITLQVHCGSLDIDDFEGGRRTLLNHGKTRAAVRHIVHLSLIFIRFVTIKVLRVVISHYSLRYVPANVYEWEDQMSNPTINHFMTLTNASRIYPPGS